MDDRDCNRRQQKVLDMLVQLSPPAGGERPPQAAADVFGNTLPPGFSEKRRRLLGQLLRLTVTKIIVAMRESRSYILKGLLALAVTFLVVQFVGYKIFVDKVEKHFDTSPWGMARYLVETCNKVELPVFVVEPSLLRALRVGEGALDLWNRARNPVITFGVIDASVEELHNLMSRCSDLNHLELDSADPRDHSLDTKQNYRTIPSHYFLWRQTSAAPLLHLVVFYRRGDYIWHAAAVDGKIKSLPVNTSLLSVGQHEGAIEKFSIKSEKIKGLTLAYPVDTSSFVWGLQHSKFVECDYARARHFFTKYGRKNIQDMAEFRRKGRQLLSVVVKTLDSMALPFWLSSGTCLGWFRQCDIIPYSKDVDIGIFIKDYREELVTALENVGLKLVQTFGKVSDSLEHSFAYDDVKLDIFFFYEEKDYIWNGGTQASTGKKFKYIFPKFTLAWTEFLGLRVRVPDPALPYIQANYGKKWEVPVRDWDWKKSPANVHENGVWPVHEWNEVIQLFEWEAELPVPVLEQLLTALSPCQLLTLERKLGKADTAAAWRKLCEKLRYANKRREPWEPPHLSHSAHNQRYFRSQFLKHYLSTYLLPFLVHWPQHDPGLATYSDSSAGKSSQPSKDSGYFYSSVGSQNPNGCKMFSSAHTSDSGYMAHMHSSFEPASLKQQSEVPMGSAFHGERLFDRLDKRNHCLRGDEKAVPYRDSQVGKNKSESEQGRTMSQDKCVHLRTDSETGSVHTVSGTSSQKDTHSEACSHSADLKLNGADFDGGMGDGEVLLGEGDKPQTLVEQDPQEHCELDLFDEALASVSSHAGAGAGDCGSSSGHSQWLIDGPGSLNCETASPTMTVKQKGGNSGNVTSPCSCVAAVRKGHVMRARRQSAKDERCLQDESSQPPSLCNLVHGIETLSLVSCASSSESQTEPLLSILASWLPGWTALRQLVLHLDTGQGLDLASSVLLGKIRVGQLTSLVLRLGSSCGWARCFFWDVLQAIASRIPSSLAFPCCNNAEPMKHFAFSSDYTPVEGHLHLEDRVVEGVTSLCVWDTGLQNSCAMKSLAEYIACDQSLCCLSLKDCDISPSDAEVLITALNKREPGKLEQLELQGVDLSLGWSSLCLLLSSNLALTALTLSDCKLTAQHSDGLVHFVPAVVFAGSSLKTLKISNTRTDLQSLQCLADALLQAPADCMPLLDSLTVSGLQWRSDVSEQSLLLEKLHRIAVRVELEGDDYLSDYVAQM
ncbi:hypothetical protein BaRGS_00007643 [Batillaria attramentaria]|uniref:Fukutin n=1 Tax=Batillaria attramentaria TaxID=370345 RepID=A0ABD0LNV9_9CAEN